MDMNSIIQLIGTLGFPIFCCMYMAWYINKVQEHHNKEISKLMEIVNNNTLAITKLTDKIENLEKVSDKLVGM